MKPLPHFPYIVLSTEKRQPITHWKKTEYHEEPADIGFYIMCKMNKPM
jgi:hypothetical protein